MSDSRGLDPGSPLPRDAREMDLLLRRVPEVALLPEFSHLRLPVRAPAAESSKMHAARVAELADSRFLERVRQALRELEGRASKEDNGGLRFVASSLSHFVTTLPAERHPLVVALYFLSLADSDHASPNPDILASQMDDYESGL